MLDIAISNTDRLVRLVNDILDLERISSGKTELRSTMCSAEDLLRRAAGRAVAAGLDPLIVVLGHEADRAERELAKGRR